MGGPLIEVAERASCKPGDFAKGLLSERVAAFKKHEHRHADQSDLSGGLANGVDAFFEGIADVNGGIDLASACLAQDVAHDLADLGVAAAAADLGHQCREARGVADPFR